MNLEIGHCCNLVVNMGDSKPAQKSGFTVLVEGNIGCGKTTFLDKFRPHADFQVKETLSSEREFYAIYSDFSGNFRITSDFINTFALATSASQSPNHAIFDILCEPLEKWTNFRGMSGRKFNLLKNLYSDIKQNSACNQNYFLLCFLENHIQEQTAKVKIMERSMFANRFVFGELAYKLHYLNEIEYTALHRWFCFVKDHFKPRVDLIVYLQASPETCFKRIQSRQRTEEENIPFKYIKDLHETYEDWLFHRKFHEPDTPIKIINAEQHMSNEEFEKLREELLKMADGNQ